MKIKSLFLGSIAAAGLSTGAYAADLSVLTSLDTCDTLGISGLKISSETNCLTISGEIEYEFSWGDYNGTAMSIGTAAGATTVSNNDQYTNTFGSLAVTPTGVGTSVAVGAAAGAGTIEIDAAGAFTDNDGDGIRDANEGGFNDLDNDGVQDAGEATLAWLGITEAAGTTDATDTYDWDSKVDAFIKFVATSDSDFGDAKAVLKIGYDDDLDVNNERTTAQTSNVLTIDEAYVSVGDSTIIMAGKKGSVFNKDHDESYGWLGLFNEKKVDNGVDTPVTRALDDGGHVIQVTSDLGNGVTISGGLEELNQLGAGPNVLAGNPVIGAPGYSTAPSGVFVGVLEYAGDTFSGHVSVIGGGFLDGTVENWAVHAGLEATVDMFKFTGAVAADNANYINVLAAVAATFDMFTLTGAVEYVDPNTTAAGGEDLGFAATAEAAVTDTVSVNAGFRYYDSNTAAAATETWQAALQLVAEVTENVTLTGEVGAYVTSMPVADVTYGSVEVAWDPSDEFSTSVKGEMNSAGAYKVTYKAKKTFE